MFERYANFDKAARQVRRYREKFDISYPTLTPAPPTRTPPPTASRC